MMNTELDRQIFEKVKNHLLTQNAKSMMYSTFKKRDVCAYRGKDGMKCAVGCLIDNSAYDPIIEEKASHAIEVEAALKRSGIRGIDNRITMILTSLQQIHDTNDPSEWAEELNKVELLYFGEAG